MDRVNKRELLIGIAMLGAGLVYLFLTMGLPRKAFIDAAFVPYLLAAGMCVLGALQLLSARRSPEADGDTPAAAKDSADYATVGKTLGLIIGYIALLEWAGFPLATVAYLYLQFIGLTPLSQKVAHGRYLLIAVLASALIYALFRHGFDLMLPAGLLGFIE